MSDDPTPDGPVAIIDCGTNTIRLLIAESDGHGGLIERDRRMEIVRLGQGVDATGTFHPDALQRTFAATERYAAVITEHQVRLDRVRFVATSASRDVSNRDAFFDGIVARLGVRPDVITGDDEARLSFSGAVAGALRDDSAGALRDDSAGAIRGDSAGTRTAAEPVLVSDIGGGSTELIIGSAGSDPQYAISLDVGSVRITERFWTADPPTADDLERATRHVDGLLDGSGIDWPVVDTWVGVAGTLTTMAAIDLDLVEYDRTRVDGHRITLDRLSAIAAELAGSTSDQIRERDAVHPQRADVITAGALIATRIAARLQVKTLIVSESDILDGCALRMLASGDRRAPWGDPSAC